MKIILSLGTHHYLSRIGILLIALALIAGMVSCDANGVETYDLMMAAEPVAGGTATDETNGSPYPEGANVSIKAQANAGYEFVCWTATAGTLTNSNAAQTTFTMPAQDVTVTANFAAFSRGDGTEEDPYQIANWYQLHIVRNHMDSYFILVNNLDSSTAGYTELASPTANEGKGWEPIGTENDPFTGTFDGQGYEVRDLFINRPDEEYVGLLGYIGGCVIENVSVVNAEVTGGESVGGLVGEDFGGNVSGSYSTGSVTGDKGVGGLVGRDLWGNVSGSYSTGSVTGDKGVGGLVGEDFGGNVSGSYSTSSVTGNIWVGGLVGNNVGTVSSSYSTGSVNGSSSVGGLVGVNSEHVSDSYSTGNVIGVDDVGGLVGWNFVGNVSNSFWDTETSGQATSDGGTGKNTTEMQDITTFSGATWDIVAVVNSSTRNPVYLWNIVDDETYPFLSWEPVS